MADTNCHFLLFALTRFQVRLTPGSRHVSLARRTGGPKVAEIIPIQPDDPEEDKIAYTVNAIRRGGARGEPAESHRNHSPIGCPPPRLSHSAALARPLRNASGCHQRQCFRT